MKVNSTAACINLPGAVLEKESPQVQMGQIKSTHKTLPETALNTILLGNRAGEIFKKRAMVGLPAFSCQEH